MVRDEGGDDVLRDRDSQPSGADVNSQSHFYEPPCLAMLAAAQMLNRLLNLYPTFFI